MSWRLVSAGCKGSPRAEVDGVTVMLSTPGLWKRLPRGHHRSHLLRIGCRFLGRPTPLMTMINWLTDAQAISVQYMEMADLSFTSTWAKWISSSESYLYKGLCSINVCKGSSSVGTGEGPESRLTIYEKEKEGKLFISLIVRNADFIASYS